MQPIGRKVLIEPKEKEEKSTSGVLMPTDRKESVAKGTVIAVGDEVVKVKVGQKVIFSPVFYDEVAEDRLVVSEEDIFVILSD